MSEMNVHNGKLSLPNNDNSAMKLSCEHFRSRAFSYSHTFQLSLIAMP